MSAGDAAETNELRGLLPKLFAASGTTFEPTPGGEETRTLSGGERRTFDRGALVDGDDRSPAVTTLWSCSDGARMVLGIVVSPDDAGKLPAAIDWLTRIRCSQPGDTTSFESPSN